MANKWESIWPNLNQYVILGLLKSFRHIKSQVFRCRPRTPGRMSKQRSWEMLGVVYTALSCICLIMNTVVAPEGLYYTLPELISLPVACSTEGHSTDTSELFLLWIASSWKGCTASEPGGLLEQHSLSHVFSWHLFVAQDSIPISPAVSLQARMPKAMDAHQRWPPSVTTQVCLKTLLSVELREGLWEDMNRCEVTGL